MLSCWIFLFPTIVRCGLKFQILWITTMIHHHDVIILLLNKGVQKKETESYLIWNLSFLKKVVPSFLKSQYAVHFLYHVPSEVSEVRKLSIRCKNGTESAREPLDIFSIFFSLKTFEIVFRVDLLKVSALDFLN